YFVGHKTHKIDAKGRISIPANMRTALGQEFIVSRGVNKCLALYPMEVWNEMINEILSKVNQKKRRALELHFSANAEKMSLDGQGRLMLNPDLRAQVELLDESQAEIFGNNKKIEIWNCDLFRKELESVEDVEIEDILDEYGI
ncbi:MAG: hypothetical protein K2J35_07800, partial [Eubacterium sp.]|nr:hypothetical protein [Eubacterium sp.]